MTVQILRGDCRAVLPTLVPRSVQCCVTSPPYFGLRDYGHAEQIGLEPSPDEYIATMVEVFRGVRDVLADDGTLWLNIGDSYATSGGKDASGTRRGRSGNLANAGVNGAAIPDARIRPGAGIKAKDLIGIPWMLAFALRADGWYLRQDIIWSKPNAMPESVRDRCTKAHEYVFLLSKSERYYFDSDAMQEPCVSSERDLARAKVTGRGEQDASSAYLGSPQQDKSGGFPTRSRRNSFARETKYSDGASGQTAQHRLDREPIDYSDTRNRRSVWTIATRPYPGAHFATMAPELAETCIAAGCPEGGTVLDPFGGAGTTGLVADRLHRSAVLIELNDTFADLARDRIQGESPLFAEIA
jgi:DNA modification methylase